MALHGGGGGGGGGTVDGSGAATRVAIWSDADTLTSDTGITYDAGTDTLTLGSLTLTTDLSIANGGTGQSTATAAFDALSPTTTLGDIIYHDGTDNVRLAGNTTATKKFLRQTGDGAASAAPAWDTIIVADIPNADLIGTANQVVLSASGVDTLLGTTNITLSLPQNIHTAATPTFASLSLSATSNQIILQSAGVTGTITWTPTSAGKTVTIQDVTGTLYVSTGTDVALADGGTNASLVASNGGIFYSTATAGAILSATATALQMLQSGASGAPAWSTTTWPATTTVNRILYSSATSVIGQITTGNSSVLVTDGSGVPSISTDIPTAVTIGTAYIYRVGGTDVAIADGGTGQSTATAGFDALAPTTTKGDIIVYNGTDNIRVAVGADATVLTADAAEASGVKWAAVAGGGGTLDAAYDFGGAGAGRTITVDTGAVTLTGGGTTVGGFTVDGSRTIASAAGAVWNEVLIDADVSLSGVTDVTTAAGFNMVAFNAPTITDAGTITSVTNAATVYIAGPPVGSGLTVTNPYSFWVDSGSARFDLEILCGSVSSTLGPSIWWSSDAVSVSTSSYNASFTIQGSASARAFSFSGNGRTSGGVTWFTVDAGSHTAQTAGAEVLDVDFVLNGTLQHASNTAVATQRCFVIRGRTYSFASATGTITEAVTFEVANPPLAGSNAIVVSSYASRFVHNNALPHPQVVCLQNSTGDTGIRFTIGTTTSWMVGADNSDTDAFCVSYQAGAGAVLGTSNFLKITTAGDVTLAGSVTMADAKNFILNTTTGTKFGTATTQKLAFYNATPVVQGASVADASGGAIIDAEARTALNALISRIEATGLIATV